jgi:hypothetical protein
MDTKYNMILIEAFFNKEIKPKDFSDLLMSFYCEYAEMCLKHKEDMNVLNSETLPIIRVFSKVLSSVKPLNEQKHDKD